VFVHAGVRPGVPLDEQRRADLLWIRVSALAGTIRENCGSRTHAGARASHEIESDWNRYGRGLHRLPHGASARERHTHVSSSRKLGVFSGALSACLWAVSHKPPESACKATTA
jgi:hypothetical protein